MQPIDQISVQYFVSIVGPRPRCWRDRALRVITLEKKTATTGEDRSSVSILRRPTGRDHRVFKLKLGRLGTEFPSMFINMQINTQKNAYLFCSVSSSKVNR